MDSVHNYSDDEKSLTRESDFIDSQSDSSAKDFFKSIRTRYLSRVHSVSDPLKDTSIIDQAFFKSNSLLDSKNDSNEVNFKIHIENVTTDDTNDDQKDYSSTSTDEYDSKVLAEAVLLPFENNKLARKNTLDICNEKIKRQEAIDIYNEKITRQDAFDDDDLPSEDTILIDLNTESAKLVTKSESCAIKPRERTIFSRNLSGIYNGKPKSYSTDNLHENAEYKEALKEAISLDFLNISNNNSEFSLFTEGSDSVFQSPIEKNNNKVITFDNDNITYSTIVRRDSRVHSETLVNNFKRTKDDDNHDSLIPVVKAESILPFPYPDETKNTEFDSLTEIEDSVPDIIRLSPTKFEKDVKKVNDEIKSSFKSAIDRMKRRASFMDTSDVAPEITLEKIEKERKGEETKTTFKSAFERMKRRASLPFIQRFIEPDSSKSNNGNDEDEIPAFTDTKIPQRILDCKMRRESSKGVDIIEEPEVTEEYQNKNESRVIEEKQIDKAHVTEDQSKLDETQILECKNIVAASIITEDSSIVEVFDKLEPEESSLIGGIKVETTAFKVPVEETSEAMNLNEFAKSPEEKILKSDVKKNTNPFLNSHNDNPTINIETSVDNSYIDQPVPEAKVENTATIPPKITEIPIDNNVSYHLKINTVNDLVCQDEPKAETKPNVASPQRIDKRFNFMPIQILNANYLSNNDRSPSPVILSPVLIQPIFFKQNQQQLTFEQLRTSPTSIYYDDIDQVVNTQKSPNLDVRTEDANIKKGIYQKSGKGRHLPFLSWKTFGSNENIPDSRTPSPSKNMSRPLDTKLKVVKLTKTPEFLIDNHYYQPLENVPFRINTKQTFIKPKVSEIKPKEHLSLPNANPFFPIEQPRRLSEENYYEEIGEPTVPYTPKNVADDDKISNQNQIEEFSIPREEILNVPRKPRRPKKEAKQNIPIIITDDDHTEIAKEMASITKSVISLSRSPSAKDLPKKPKTGDVIQTEKKPPYPEPRKLSLQSPKQPQIETNTGSLPREKPYWKTREHKRLSVPIRSLKDPPPPRPLRKCRLV